MADPALTPEQWAEIKECAADSGYHGPSLIRGPVLYYLSADGTKRLFVVEGYDDPALVDGGTQHALAAFCLHGQDFGFTPEDVALLRYSVALSYDGAEDVLGVATQRTRVLDLAARIEALLPPVSTP